MRNGKNEQTPLAIFGPGEEVHFEFSQEDFDSTAADIDADELHLSGYIFHLQGWCKDLDLYTKTGDTLAPTPSFSDVDRELELKYNSRYESGPWFSYPMNIEE